MTDLTPPETVRERMRRMIAELRQDAGEQRTDAARYRSNADKAEAAAATRDLEADEWERTLRRNGG